MTMVVKITLRYRRRLIPAFTSLYGTQMGDKIMARAMIKMYVERLGVQEDGIYVSC